MDHLARRPLPRRRPHVQLLIGRPDERLRDDAIPVPVLVEQFLASIRIHIFFVPSWFRGSWFVVRGSAVLWFRWLVVAFDQPRVLAMPGAAASCSVAGSR